MKAITILGIIGLLCWVVMFLAGTDVWHFAGSPDFWHRSDPPYNDLKAFGYAFYIQFVILVGIIGMGIWDLCRTKRSRESRADYTGLAQTGAKEEHQ